MLLRDSKYKGSWSLSDVARVAADSAGDDTHRRDFVSLVRTARQLLRS